MRTQILYHKQMSSMALNKEHWMIVDYETFDFAALPFLFPVSGLKALAPVNNNSIEIVKSYSFSSHILQNQKQYTYSR